MDDNAAASGGLAVYPYYESLKTEVEKLRNELAALVLENNELEIECKNIEMEYMLAIGWLENKVLETEVAVLRLKREVDMIQALINLQNEIDLDKIGGDLDSEFADYQAKVAAQAERARGARSRRDRQERNRSEYGQRNRQAWENRFRSQSEKRSGEEHASEGNGRQTAGNGAGAFFGGGQPAENDDEASWARMMYRRIVKALHPDVNPGADEAALNLLRKANAAYEDGDLESLQLYYESVNKPLEAEEGPGAIARLREEKARLIMLVEKTKAMIAERKTKFPYTAKDLVNDPERVAARKAELDGHIAKLNEALDDYKEKIDKMVG